MITNYNPDVLSCLANLSNDEVFTPPSLANQVLDLLPRGLWSNKEIKFLDPVCKTGVFLREIAKRLIKGLESEIPDLQERVNHIYKNQLYGIAITELTALLTRRTLYCSKRADSPFSVCTEFEFDCGNIFYNKIDHSWKNGKCFYCGADQRIYDRTILNENYAYNFIHINNPDEIFNMKFDVIIGNPPYQLTDGGAKASASPIYHKFVNQAKKLNPRYLTMIIPSRWFAGGKGLDEFRFEMLNDKRISKLVDFFDSTICFPGVDISGGVSYFLWEENESKYCEVISVNKNSSSTLKRPLLEKSADVFIRFNEAISIYRKVSSKNEHSFENQISSRKPFGITTNHKLLNQSDERLLKTFAFPQNGYIEKDKIIINADLIDTYKIFISYAYGERGHFPYYVIGKPFIGMPGTVCTETYLMIGPYESNFICENVITYIKTKFFRFLVLLRKNTQHATSKVYGFVPLQDFTYSWTDEKLYKKYGLTEEEIKFIDSMIKPME